MRDQRVTRSFASPRIAEKLTRACLDTGQTLPALRVFMVAQAQGHGVTNLEGGSHGAGSLSSIFPRGIQVPGGNRAPSEVSLPHASAGGMFYSGKNGKWQCLTKR